MDSKIFQFSSSNNLILACHISGVYDVNRNITLEDDSYELVSRWVNSVSKAKIQGIIFHNNFSLKTISKYTNEYVSFIKIDYNPQFNPNTFRYFVYRDFLKQHANLIKSVFVTDVSDVTVVKNPFIDPYFMDNTTSIFCGDESKILENDWMYAHSTHLRNQIDNFSDYEKNFRNEILLNCGIIGGGFTIFYEFIQKLCSIHQQFNSDNPSAYTGDMGAFNYLARTQYNENLKFGVPVNTIFKMYEGDRQDCWFRHK